LGFGCIWTIKPITDFSKGKMPVHTDWDRLPKNIQNQLNQVLKEGIEKIKIILGPFELDEAHLTIEVFEKCASKGSHSIRIRKP